MGLIHARRIGGKIYYREWSTVSDSYSTPALSFEEMEEHMLVFDKDKAENRDRLRRASRNGTSRHGRIEDLDSNWYIERCIKCSVFHHTYAPSETWKHDSDCRECGEKEGDKAHRPPCLLEGVEAEIVSIQGTVAHIVSNVGRSKVDVWMDVPVESFTGQRGIIAWQPLPGDKQPKKPSGK